MVHIITTIGILILVIGVVFTVQPELIRKFIDFAKVGNRCYLGGVVRVILGALLLIATPKASLPWIPGIIGVIAVIAGILIFVLGVQKMHAILDWVNNLPDTKLRLMPIVAAIIGILLIYSV
ncbi:MAG: hypothetical protein ABH859_02655 [Pseudomonadota bacterium]